LPGTHRLASKEEEEDRCRLENSLASWAQIARRNRQEDWSIRARWFRLGSGDAVFFDPRLLHKGYSTRGPRYSVFVSYGVANGHFLRHRNHYRWVRKDLEYGDISLELMSRLRHAGLYAKLPPLGSFHESWVPPGLFSSIARCFR
jgi:hypothetical protein